MQRYVIGYDDSILPNDIIINDTSFNTTLKLMKELDNKYPFINVNYVLNHNMRETEYRRGEHNLVYNTVYNLNEYEFEFTYSMDNLIPECKITSAKFHDCYSLLDLIFEMNINLIKIDSIIRDCCWDIILEYEKMREHSINSLRGVNVERLTMEQHKRYTDVLFSGDRIYGRKQEKIITRIKENSEIYNNIKNINIRNKEIKEDIVKINKENSIKVEQEFSVSFNMRYLYNI